MYDELNLAAIVAGFTPDVKNWLRHCRLYHQLDSTNQYLLDYPQTHLVISEQQRSGRGQHGRSWYSPAGKNIYLSVRWHTKVQQNTAQTTLIVAQAVQQLCRKLGLQHAWIKPPNDVMLNGRKAAGILIEAITEGTEVDLVIGIGINVWMQASTDQSPIDQPWTSLAEAAGITSASAYPNFNRNHMISQLLNILHNKLRQHA